jgi:peptide/nickel transport system substrate-binding protein
MANWSCSEVSGPDNNWLGQNVARWCNADYDALVAQFAQTANLEERAAIAIQQNDMIVQNGGAIPLIARASVSAVSNRVEGVLMNAWDSELWNIEDWTLAAS